METLYKEVDALADALVDTLVDALVDAFGTIISYQYHLELCSLIILR